MPLPSNWIVEELLTLSFVKGINNITLRKIVEHFDSLEHFLDSKESYYFPQNLAQSDIFNGNFVLPRPEAQQQLELCEINKVNIITIWDDDYPILLKQIDYPPTLLFIAGKLQRQDSASISVVGTRKNTLYGRLCAEKFAGSFARNNIIVTSGLAYGIDTISHTSTIAAGGITYAVIASGIDRIAPATSEKNAQKILDSGGAIISEYKCGTIARPGYFPQRNRIISGISRATLVIESGAEGGSWITAKFASYQNREVFAVPGNINSEKSMGTNKMIKSNLAVPALTPEDILKELGFLSNNLKFQEESKLSYKLSQEAQKIYDALSFEPVHIDELSVKADMEITELLVKLLDLEFKGIVRQLPGKHYIRNG